MFKKSLIIFMFTLSCSAIYAKNLGIQGATFQIIEKNFLEFIKEKLMRLEENGEMEKFKEDAQNKVKEQILRPKSTNLPMTTNPQKFLYDPTYILKQNITDGKGNVIYKKGLSFNPLDSKSYPKGVVENSFSNNLSTMVFFNADSVEQMKYVKKLLESSDNSQEKYMLIMLKGNVKETAEKLGTRIYFDQAGVLSKKFKLKNSPSLVYRKNNYFEIQEINPLRLSDEI